MSPSHLPITSGRKVVSALECVGFVHVKTKGDHAKLRQGDRVVIVPLHRELKRGTMASILKQAGLTPEEMRRLL